MNPTSYKELIKLTAQQLNLSEELVRDVILFYYKRKREELTCLKVVRVKLKGLGYFDIKHWKIGYEIEKCHVIRNGLLKQKDGPRRKALLEQIEKKMENLDNMQFLCDKEKKKKDLKRKQRRQYEEWEAKRDLEKQEENT